MAVKGMLESEFADVWVTGEISNFRGAASGHCYFTLKDNVAQVRAVCFRNQARYLKFKPRDGLSVIARGRLSVYEARGEYQLCVEYLEPAGAGALQVAFEQLKQKLAAEGLFELARKRPLPLLPQAIGVVSSPEGAAIRDILRVLRRRFPNMNVLLYPATVQGERAAGEIASGIRYFNRQKNASVLIVGRGGGSIEDLWPFNEETVARAIADSEIPIISAVGHETDFTIADFVADMRAPTPSAAAEMVVHPKEHFTAEIGNRVRRLTHALRLHLSESRERVMHLRTHRALQNLAGRVGEKAQRVDDLTAAMETAVRGQIEHGRRQSLALSVRLARHEPGKALALRRAQIQQQQSAIDKTISELNRLTQQRLRSAHQQWLRSSSGVILFDFRRFLTAKQGELNRRIHDRLANSRHQFVEASASISRYDFPRLISLKQAGLSSRAVKLESTFRTRTAEHRNRVAALSSLLKERSPLTVLGRGYSIARDSNGQVIRDAAQVDAGDEISVRLARGELGTTVKNRKL